MLMNRNPKKLMAALVLLAHITAADVVYKSPLLTEEPSLDGEIKDDPAWVDVPAKTGFHVLGATEPAPKQTYFRLGYTTGGVYAAIHCQEPDMNDVVAELSDGEAVWDEDSVEVFVHTAGGRTFQFAVNAAGSRASPNTLARWQAEIGYFEDAWNVELFIPWEVFGEAPTRETAWRINVCRTIRTVPEEKLHTTWAVLRESFHEKDAYRNLYFLGYSDTVHAAIEAHVEEHAIVPYRYVYSQPRTGMTLHTGDGEQRVVFSQGARLAPRLGPCGTRVLYTSEKVRDSAVGVPAIWLTDLDGNTQRLCDGRRASWSREGERFVFERGGDIYERTIGEGTERQFPVQNMTWPKYHPAGGLLLVGLDTPYLYRLHEDGALERLVPTAGGPARCSPDGNMIAYQYGAHIRVLYLDTGKTRRVTYQPGVQAYPAWTLHENRLCYAATADPFIEQYPFGAHWDIYSVDIAHPLAVTRILARVNAAFDWQGGIPEAAAADALRGGIFTLTHDNSLNRHGATTNIETAWFSLKKATDHLVLAGARTEARARIHLSDGAGRRLDTTMEIAQTAEGAASASLGHGVKSSLSHNRPVITFSGAGADSADICITADAGLLLIPDRYGDDLILSSADFSGVAAWLPTAPYYLLLAGGGNAMFMLYPNGVPVSAGVSDRAISLRITPGAGEFSLALLEHDNIWTEADATVNNAQQHKTPFRHSFHAQWRCATRSDGLFAARMWPMQDILEHGREPLPLPRDFGRAPDQVIFYAHGRVPLTPLDTWTPMDVFYDSASFEAAVDMKQPAGLLNYLPRGLASRELSTRSAHWEPFEGHLESPYFGVLEILSGIFPDDTPGVRMMVENLTGDALDMLRGLDARLEEYSQRLAALAARARQEEMSAVAARLYDAAEEADGLPQSALDPIKTLVEDLKGRIGSREDIYWNTHIISRDEVYNRLREACKQYADERLAAIAIFRQAARDARNTAGMAAMADAALYTAAETLREDIADLLARRWFMEGDWRGETPFSTGDPIPWQ